MQNPQMCRLHLGKRQRSIEVADFARRAVAYAENGFDAHKAVPFAISLNLSSYQTRVFDWNQHLTAIKRLFFLYANDMRHTHSIPEGQETKFLTALGEGLLEDDTKNERTRMPYLSNQDLPDGVRNHLPPHAQDIYREAFNHAWQQYADPQKRKLGDTRESVAQRVAWAAVKRKYQKDGDFWVLKEGI
jgi:cation transport regulator